MDASRDVAAAQVKREFLARWPESYLTNYRDSYDPLDFMTAVTAIQPASSYQRHLAPIGNPPVMFVSIPVDPQLGGDPDKLDTFAQYFRDTVLFNDQELFDSAQYDHIEAAVANTLLLPQCKNPLPLGAFNLTTRSLSLARNSEAEEASEDARGGALSEFTVFFDFYFNLASHALTVRVPSYGSSSSPGEVEIPPNGYLVHRIDSGKVVPGNVDVAAPSPNAAYLYLRYTATRLFGVRTYEPSIKRRRLSPDKPDVSYAWSTSTGPQAVRLLREPRVSQRPRDLLLEDMIALPHLHFGLNEATSFIEQYLVNSILTTVADRKSLCDSLYVTPYDGDFATPSPINRFVRWGAVIPYEPGTFDLVLHAVYMTRGSVRIEFDYGNHRPLPYWPVNAASPTPSDALLSFNLSLGKFIFFGNTQAFRLVPVGPAPEFRRFTYLLSTTPRSKGARKVSDMARNYGVQAEDNQAGADAWFTRVDPMGKPLSVLYATTMQYQSLPQIPESPDPTAPPSPLAEPSYNSPSQGMGCTVCEHDQASGDSFTIYREELATKVQARVAVFAREPTAWSGRLDLQPCATCQALLVRALYFYEDVHPMDVAFTWREGNFTPEVATSPESPRRLVAAGTPTARPKGKRSLPTVPPKTPSPAEVSDGPLDLIRVMLRQLGFILRPSVSSTGFYDQLKDPSKPICQASIQLAYIREVLRTSTVLYQIFLQKADREIPVAFLALVPNKDPQGSLNLALLCSRVIYASRHLDGTPNDSTEPVKTGFGILLVYTAIRYALGQQVGLELHAATATLVGYYRSLGFLAAKRLDQDPALSSDPVDIDHSYEDFLTHRGPTVSRELAPALFLHSDGTGYLMVVPRTHLAVAAEKCLAFLATKVVGPVYNQLLKHSSIDDPTTFRVEPRSPFPAIQVVQNLVARINSLQTETRPMKPFQCFKRGHMFVAFAPNSASNLAVALFIPLPVVEELARQGEPWVYSYFVDVVLDTPKIAADTTKRLLKELQGKGAFLVTYGSFQGTWTDKIEEPPSDWFTVPVDLGLPNEDGSRATWTSIDAMVAHVFAEAFNQPDWHAYPKEALSATYGGYTVNVKDQALSQATIHGGALDFPLQFYFHPHDISDMMGYSTTSRVLTRSASKRLRPSPARAIAVGPDPDTPLPNPSQPQLEVNEDIFISYPLSHNHSQSDPPGLAVHHGTDNKDNATEAFQVFSSLHEKMNSLGFFLSRSVSASGFDDVKRILTSYYTCMHNIKIPYIARAVGTSTVLYQVTLEAPYTGPQVAFLAVAASTDPDEPDRLMLLCSSYIFALHLTDGKPENPDEEPPALFTGFGIALIYVAMMNAIRRNVGLKLWANADVIEYYRSLGFLVSAPSGTVSSYPSDPEAFDRAYAARNAQVKYSEPEDAPGLDMLQHEGDGYPLVVPLQILPVALEKCQARLTATTARMLGVYMRISTAANPVKFRIEQEIPSPPSKLPRLADSRLVATGPGADIPYSLSHDHSRSEAPMIDPIGLFFETVVTASRRRRRAAADLTDADGDTPMTLDTTTETDVDGFAALRGFTVARRTLLMYDFQEEKEGLGKLWVIVAPYLSEKDKINLSAAFGLGVADRVVLANRAQKKGNVPSEDQGKESFRFYKVLGPYTAVGMRFDRKGTANLIELLRRASGPQRARMQKRLTQDEEGDDAAPSKLVRTMDYSPEDDYDVITGNLLTTMIEATKTLEVVGESQFRSLAALKNITELRYREEFNSRDDPMSFVTSAVTYIRDTPAMVDALLNLKTLELRAEKDQGRFTYQNSRDWFGLLFSDIPARLAGLELPIVLPHLKELVLTGTSVLRCADLDALGLIRFDVDWVPRQIMDVANVTVYTPRVTILQLAHLQARFVQQGTLYKPYFYSNSLVKFTCNGLPLGADSTIIQHRRNGRCNFPNATEISFYLQLCPTINRLSVQPNHPALAYRALALTLPSHQFPSVHTLRVIVDNTAYRQNGTVSIDLYSLFIPDPSRGEERLETPLLERLVTNLHLFTHGPDGTRAIPFGAIPGSEEHQFPSLAIIEADGMTIQTTGTDFLALLPSLKLVTVDSLWVDTPLVDVPFEPLESNKECIFQANGMIISTGGNYFNLGVRLVAHQISSSNILWMKFTGLRIPASSIYETDIFDIPIIRELEIGNGLALANHPIWSDAEPLCFTRIQLPSTLVSFIDDSWINFRVPRITHDGAPAKLDYLQLVNYEGNPLRIHSDLRYTRFVVAGPNYKRLNFSELEEILFIAVASYLAADAHPWAHIRALSVAQGLIDTRTEPKEEYHAVKAHLEEIDGMRCLVCLIIQLPDTPTARKIATEWLVQEYTADALGRTGKTHLPSDLQAVRIAFKLPSNPGQLTPLLARLPTVVRTPRGLTDSVDYPRDISDFIAWSIPRAEVTLSPHSEFEDDPRVYKWAQQRQAGGAIARAILDCHAHSVEGSDAFGPEIAGQLKGVTHLTMNVSKARMGTLAYHIQAYWHPPLRKLLKDVVSIRLMTTDVGYSSKMFIRPPLIQALIDRLADHSKSPEPPLALTRLVCSGDFDPPDILALGFETDKRNPLRGNPVTRILLPGSLESLEIGLDDVSVNWNGVFCESTTLKRLCLRGNVPSGFHHWSLPALEVLELDLTTNRISFGEPWLWNFPNLRELTVSIPVHLPFPLKGPLPEYQEISSVAEYNTIINWRQTRLVNKKVYLLLPNLRTLKLRNVDWELTDPDWLAPELVAVHTNVEYTTADANLIRARFGPGFDFVHLSDSNLEGRLTTLFHDIAAVAFSTHVTGSETLPHVIIGTEFVAMHVKSNHGAVCLMVMLLEGPLRIQNTTYETLEQFQQLHTQFKSRYETNGIEELCYSFGQSVPLICLDFGNYLYETNLRDYFEPRYDTDLATDIRVVHAPAGVGSTLESTLFARQVITTPKKAVYVTNEDTLDLVSRLRETYHLVTIGVSPSAINRLSFRTGPLAKTLVQLHVDMPSTTAFPALESVQTVGLVPLGRSLESLREVRCTGWQFEFGFLQALGLGETRANGEYVLADRLKMLEVTVDTSDPGIFTHTISGVGLELLKITGTSDASPTGRQADIQPHLWYLPRLKSLFLQDVLSQLQFPQSMRAWSFRTSLQSIDFVAGNPRDTWPSPVIVRHGLRLIFPTLQEYTFLSYQGEIARPYELDELLVGGLCNDADSQTVTAWWTSVKANAQSPDLTLNRILPLPNWANHVLGTRLSFTNSVMNLDFTRYSTGPRDSPKTVSDGHIGISFNLATAGANRAISDIFVETVLQRGLTQIDMPKRVGPDVIQGPDLAWVYTSPSPDTTEALTNWLEYTQTYQEVAFDIKFDFPKHVVCTIPFGFDVLQSMRHIQTLVIECNSEADIATMFAARLSEAALSSVERLIFRATTPMEGEGLPRSGTRKKWTLPNLRHLTFDGVPTRVWILESLGLLTDTYIPAIKNRRYVISRISDLDIFLPLIPGNIRENRSIETHGIQSTTITKLTYRGGPLAWVNFHLPNLTHLDAGDQVPYDHGKLRSLFPRLCSAFPSIQVVEDLIIRINSLQLPTRYTEPVQCFKRGDMFVAFAPNSTSNLAFALFIPVYVVKERLTHGESYMYRWFEDLVLGAPNGVAVQTTLLLKDLGRKGAFLVTFKTLQGTWSGEIEPSKDWFEEPVDLGLLHIDEIRSAWTPIDTMVASAFAISSNQVSANATNRDTLSTTYDGYIVDVNDRDYSQATIRGRALDFPLQFFFYPYDISDVADNLVSSGTAGTSSRTEAQREANVPPSDRTSTMPALNGYTIAESSDEAAATTDEEVGDQTSMWDWDNV